MVLKGHCLCGAVTYTVDVDAPLLTGYDHCDDCQRQSGSTYCELWFLLFSFYSSHLGIIARIFFYTVSFSAIYYTGERAIVRVCIKAGYCIVHLL